MLFEGRSRRVKATPDLGEIFIVREYVVFLHWPFDILLLERIRKSTWSRHNESHINLLDLVAYRNKFFQLIEVLVGVHVSKIISHEYHHVLVINTKVNSFLNIVDHFYSLFLGIVTHKRWVILKNVITILPFIDFESFGVIIALFIVDSSKNFVLLTLVLAQWSPQEGILFMVFLFPHFSLTLIDSCEVDSIKAKISEKRCISS
jgi:hypothetical protein